MKDKIEKGVYKIIDIGRLDSRFDIKQFFIGKMVRVEDGDCRKTGDGFISIDVEAQEDIIVKSQIKSQKYRSTLKGIIIMSRQIKLEKVK